MLYGVSFFIRCVFHFDRDDASWLALLSLVSLFPLLALFFSSCTLLLIIIFIFKRHKTPRSGGVGNITVGDKTVTRYS